MSNALSIVPPVKAVDDVVELLERTLEAARRGDIRGVLIASVRVGGDISSAWAHDPVEYDQFRMIGALRFAEHRILAGVGEGS